MMNWLLEQNTKARLDHILSTDFKPSASQMETFAVEAKDGSSMRAGFIEVEGVLTEKPDIFAFLFGGGNTTYSSIAEQLIKFDADSSISEIVMEFNSPGGTVAGLFELFEVMENVSKPIIGRIGGMAASACFGIASQCDRVEAKSVASMVGSVGVVQTHFIDDDEIDITSTEAPNKRPDVSTDDGKRVVVKMLDDLHGLFAGAIAKGRNTTIDNVNANFGRGSIVLATEAEKLGMIDCICDGAFTITKNKVLTESKNMNKTELMSKHPELYSEIVSEAVATERDRVSAHLEYGIQGKCMDIASKAIEDGTAVTQALTAKYATAAQNVAAQGTRADGDTTASDALTGIEKEKEEFDALDKQTSALLTEKFGE